MRNEIYLDNSATTPVAEEVLQAMEPYWRIQYGNPSSPHLRGVAAENTLNSNRKQLARLLQAEPEHLYFTASGTEANNIAILGAASSPFFGAIPATSSQPPLSTPPS